jgi:alkylation response protein AidB-like acyl-CoA dehydrogenase
VQQTIWLPALADGQRRMALVNGTPDIAPARAVHRDGVWELSGAQAVVLGGDVADAFLVAAVFDEGGEIGLFLVRTDQPGVTAVPIRLLDGRGAADLTLASAPGEFLGVGSGARALSEGLAHGAIALCAELIGAMERTIEITADYLRTRQQFGTALASFQALQHRMADMAAELEIARSMLFAALAAFEVESPTRRDEVLAGAKAFISLAALNVCGQGIQLHGGIGMTDEYAIGHYYKRAVVNAGLLGGITLCEEACAAALRERLLAPETGADRHAR